MKITCRLNYCALALATLFSLGACPGTGPSKKDSSGNSDAGSDGRRDLTTVQKDVGTAKNDSLNIIANGDCTEAGDKIIDIMNTSTPQVFTGTTCGRANRYDMTYCGNGTHTPSNPEFLLKVPNGTDPKFSSSVTLDFTISSDFYVAKVAVRESSNVCTKMAVAAATNFCDPTFLKQFDGVNQLWDHFYAVEKRGVNGSCGTFTLTVNVIHK